LIIILHPCYKGLNSKSDLKTLLMVIGNHAIHFWLSEIDSCFRKCSV